MPLHNILRFTSLNASERKARWFRWGYGLAGVSAAAAAMVWLAAGPAPAHKPFNGALGYQRTQAQQTIAALGYGQVAGLVKLDDGSWGAKAQKDGAHWRVRISQYGVVSAHPAPRAEAAALPQLGIVLE